MKKLFLLLFASILLFSCMKDEQDDPEFHMEFVPILNVAMPQSVTRGHTYEIEVTFKRPNDCYYFNGFTKEYSGQLVTVGAQTIVIQHAECQSLETFAPETETFNFKCSESYQLDEYTFRFYQGTTTTGELIYLEKQVAVTE